MATLASCQKYEEVDIAQSTQILSVSLSDDAATTRVSLTDGESSVTLTGRVMMFLQSTPLMAVELQILSIVAKMMMAL